MKIKFTLIFCFVAFVVSAQSLTKEQIIGKWKGISLQPIGKLANEELKELQAMFVNSTFTFLADGKCSIVLPKGSKDIKTMLANNQWLFDSKKSIIKIGSKADKFSIFGVAVKVIKGKTYFELLESGTKLEVVKQ